MNAQDVKNSILQLAIQGKLVEQREEEGTAVELYQQIQEEKAILIKEGKIKKGKPLAEITADEIPFDIPENWKWVRLGDIFKINPRNTVNDDITVSFIPMTLIKDGYRSEFSYETKSWGEVKKGYTHFRDRDIVMAKITPCFQNLKSAIMLNLENGVGAGTTELHVLRAYNDISLEFFLWFIKSPIFVSTCVTKMTGTAGQQRVGTDTITNYVSPLPPLEEQKRIVAKIKELIPYVENYDVAFSEVRELNKKFPEDLQKSILQYAIQGKLVEQREEEGTAEELYQSIQEEKEKLMKEGKTKKEKPLSEITEVEIPFDIPESWKWVKLGEIVSIKGGKRLPAGKRLTQTKTDHIYIRVTDMKNQTIDDTDLHYIDTDIYEKIKNYIIEKSDIYIVIVGSTIGKVGLVPEKFHRMNLTENAARLIPICMNKDYLIRYLSSVSAQTQFIEKTNQVGQPKLALIRLKNTLVPVPPLNEQKRIVAKIEEMMPYCQKLIQ